MIEQRSMQDVVNENFERYAGNVILDRAICDVRDMLKPSARMLIYSQVNITKNTYKKPFIKSARVVGDCLGHLYEHGDSSCYGSYMRMSKPFTMRVPLEECQGNNGTMTKNGDEASMRYTELRLSEIASYLYNGLDKNAIGDNWRNNFDETEQYPGVMPSIGYFNICNGTIGLGIAISSSIPQFSLQEVNAAIIKLIKNKDTPDKEIIIMPDFATGGILINKNEVYESLKIGSGSACKLRAVINYNPDTNILLITELPYGVYSEVVKQQIQTIMLEDEKCGIKNIHDNTGKTPEIEIELEKDINPKKIIARLYKETLLESHFTINMWVLENGRFPKIMGLREIFMNYITHIRKCERNILQFDLDKALARKNIVDGLIRAYSIIDEIVALIRASSNPSEASIKLINQYQFNEEQAKAILAMKLSSLTKLDIVKLNEEREELEREIDKLQYLLKEPTALDAELIKILQQVADKFGDERRTKILNIVEEEDNSKDIKEEEEVGVLLFNNNTIRLLPKESMVPGKRGKKGANLKPPKNAELINTLYTTNLCSIAALTSSGKLYSLSISDLNYEEDYSIYNLINIVDEQVLLLIDMTSFSSYNNIITVSKLGYIKKSATNDYNIHIKKGITAVKLDENDSLVAVFLSSSEEDKIMVASNKGNYNYYPISTITTTGRVTKGSKAIKLGENEFIAAATIIKNNLDYLGILSIASNGKGKITPIEEYSETSRGVKGNAVMALKNEDLATIAAILKDKEKIFISIGNKGLTIGVDTIPIQNRATNGVYLISINDSNSKIKIM